MNSKQKINKQTKWRKDVREARKVLFSKLKFDKFYRVIKDQTFDEMYSNFGDDEYEQQ